MKNQTMNRPLPRLAILGLVGIMLHLSLPPVALGQAPALGEQVPTEQVRSESTPTEAGQAEQAQPSLLRQAQTALREERYEEAVELWRQLAYQWPDSAEMSYNLGVALHRLFKIDDAANAYLTATVLNPKHAEAYINLSLARIQLQQYEEALAALDQVLMLADRPSDPVSLHTMAHYNRAIVLGRQGKTEESLAAVNAALEITPDFLAAQALVDLIR